MRKNRMVSFAIMLIGAILMAACGQAAAPTANASAPAAAEATQAPPAAAAIPTPTEANTPAAATAACTVLSQDEVGKILAEPVVEVRDPAKDGSLCVYQTQNLILEFNTQRIFGGFGDSVNFMKEMRSVANENGDNLLDVPGLGDEAFYRGGSGLVRVLFIRKGAIVYTFGLRNVTTDQSLSSPDNAETMEKSLAELLLSRLP
jgi:hypothetical protein